MGFARRLETTGKVPIPDSLKKELKKPYLHNIVKKIEDSNIPPSLVLNLDQMPSKYIQWNHSKADTYRTEVFVCFREVSALERFELKSSQI